MSTGRPLGTFGDPSHRARAWHWLSAVAGLADVERVRHLDRPNSHLSRGLAPKPYFDQIRQDGYDPGNVTAKRNLSLLEHVAGKRRFKSTKAIYEHKFWKYLGEWAPVWPDRAAWQTAQLRQHRIVRYTPEDEAHGIDLGLLREPDAHDPWALARPPLSLDAERFASLDGLLLLIMLCREAQDAGYLYHDDRLQEGLRRAALLFAKQHNYRDEVLDTWEMLLGSRMVAWHPRIEPTQDELTNAERELTEGERIFLDPRLAPRVRRPKVGTRSDRRWRRRVWIRACCLHLKRGWRTPPFEYRDACPEFEWLIANRTAIREHKEQAIDLLMDEEIARPDALPPLTMSEALYDSRRRPSPTEEEERVFGDKLLYDVIPVITVRSSSSGEWHRSKTIRR